MNTARVSVTHRYSTLDHRQIRNQR